MAVTPSLTKLPRLNPFFSSHPLVVSSPSLVAPAPVPASAPSSPERCTIQASVLDNNKKDGENFKTLHFSPAAASAPPLVPVSPPSPSFHLQLILLTKEIMLEIMIMISRSNNNMAYSVETLPSGPSVHLCPIHHHHRHLHGCHHGHGSCCDAHHP